MFFLRTLPDVELRPDHSKFFCPSSILIIGPLSDGIIIVKALFKDYKTLSGSMRQQLLELGFEVTEEGKHYRLTYYGDGRYKTTIAKTGSDWREGKNIASVIIKNMM